PPAPEMAVLGKMSGEYRFPYTATVRLIFGGTVQEVHFVFVGGPEIFRYTAWRPADNCYNSIFVTTLVGLFKTQLRQVDDRTFVEGGTLLKEGKIACVRLVLTCDAQGKSGCGGRR
ncbi:MAG: hypothetical protein V3R47_03120, partial [candidate division NC10 bacterium]